jgi:tRNA-splicing ligase RtcB
MGNLKLKGKDILKLGYPNNQSVNIALEVMKRNFATKNIHHVKALLKEILVSPEHFEKDLTYGKTDAQHPAGCVSGIRKQHFG